MKKYNTILPERLKKGDEIRIIAPSLPFSVLDEWVITAATIYLKEQGYKITFSNYCVNGGENSYSVSARVRDLKDAFLDSNVKAILTAIGGIDLYHILDEVDYNCIRNNPKVLCGFSDITSLSNAILVKTGLITYSGPHFSTFAMPEGLSYVQRFFDRALSSSSPYELEITHWWWDNRWFQTRQVEKVENKDGYFFVTRGCLSNNSKVCVEGQIIGGNLRTFLQLQNTSYMPDLTDKILFLEDDNFYEVDFLREFVEHLQSIMNEKEFAFIKGIVIGRAADQSLRDNLELLQRFFSSNPLLRHIPIVYGVDFGHTSPIITFPIGGICRLWVEDNRPKLCIYQGEAD